MDRRMSQRTLMVGVNLLAGLLAALACSPTLPFLGGDGGRSATDSGTGLEDLNEYVATFDATFTPDNQIISPWSYHLELIKTNSGTRRTLAIEGISAGQDPGDTTLIRVGESQYMTGEGTGSADCLIFPADLDVSSSFLLPGSFVGLSEVKSIWKNSDDVEVAGKKGDGHTFEANTLEAFSDVSGTVATSGDVVYSYDFSGHTIDENFTGEGGVLTWHYEITSFSPEETIDAPADCAPKYPIMADATSLIRLPGLITYLSRTPEAEVVAFYQNELAAAGWGVYALPDADAQERVTIVTYAKGGEILNVSIKGTDQGTEVKLFTQDKQGQP